MPFLIQGNTNWKFIGIVVVLAVIVGAGILFWSRPEEAPPPEFPPEGVEKVIITTDKSEYEQGEPINIIVKNNLKIPIFYSSLGDRFWGITPFKDGFFQLTGGDMGEDCYELFFELMPPIEVGLGSDISTQWNQKICFFEQPYSSAEPGIVKYIESGQYRLTFAYGFNEASPEEKIVYSNEFTVKQGGYFR